MDMVKNTIWIGLKKNTTTSTDTYFTDGTITNFRVYSENPFNELTLCMRFLYYFASYSDRSCSWNYAYVCKKKGGFSVSLIVMLFYNDYFRMHF